MKQIKQFLLLVAMGCMGTADAQVSEKKWGNVFTISATPAWSSGWITAYQPDLRGGYTEDQLRDSFSQADRAFQNELKVDQSVAHNGVCLTVTKIDDNGYWVTAIDETLQRTNLNHWKVNDFINLERCMPANGRFDGHIVQGHVDCVGTVDEIHDLDGSWMIFIAHDADAGITVNKGSICVNGVSLTVVDSFRDAFSVAIIPYTWEHTNLSNLQPGDAVNLEFDILGKYLKKFSVSLQISKK